MTVNELNEKGYKLARQLDALANESLVIYRLEGEYYDTRDLEFIDNGYLGDDYLYVDECGYEKYMEFEECLEVDLDEFFAENLADMQFTINSNGILIDTKFIFSSTYTDVWYSTEQNNITIKYSKGELTRVVSEDVTKVLSAYAKDKFLELRYDYL